MMRSLFKLLSTFLSAVIFLTVMLPQTSNAYTVNGSPADYRLVIEKYEQEAGDPSSPGSGLPGESPVGIPLEGVEYTLIQTHSYNPLTNQWTDVTNATPIIVTTDATGTITLTEDEGLQLGR